MNIFDAVRHNNLKTVRALIASGELVNHACFARYTPLFIASRNGHLEVVKFLIASGGSMNEADNGSRSPLYVRHYPASNILSASSVSTTHALMRPLTTNKDNEEGQGEHQEERAATPLARLLMSFTLEGRGIRKRTGKYLKKNERMNGRMNDS